MTEFVDEYLPRSILKYPFTSAPRTSTRITQVKSGHEHRNRNWVHPLHKFTSPNAIECHDDLEDVKDAWFALGGPFTTFPFRDELDFASRRLRKAGLAPTVFPTDQILGTGDGSTREFQMTKRYRFGTLTYDRKITLPIVSSVVVAMNALAPGTGDPTLPGGPYTFDVNRLAGKILFDHAPANGVLLTDGFLFDVIARFEDDDTFEAIIEAFQLSGHADLSFVEVRPCEIPGASSVSS
jgi:uncharacterized protein (TIGR02217 family)